MILIKNKIESQSKTASRLFQNIFWYLQFFQNTNKEIQLDFYGTTNQIVLIHFLEELKTQKNQLTFKTTKAWLAVKNAKKLWTLCERLKAMDE